MMKPFAAYSGQAPYLFVCYAHADGQVVYRDLTWLNDAGFNIWYDEGIAPGSTWRDEVALALSQASLVVYFASPASAASANCQQELNFALSREVPVLCVHLAKTTLPPGLELALANRQAIMRYEMADGAYRDKLGTSLERVIDVAAPATAPVVLAPAPSEGHAIAILPLANRSRDPNNEYLSDGITEELIGGLSQLDGLKVRSFLAVTPYKDRQLSPLEIGRELGVESIVSGSLQQAGERVRISVALTRVADGESLWSRHYDNDMSDIFTLQDDVARQVVDALTIELGETGADKIIDTGTDNVEAYQAYLLGRHEHGKGTPRGVALAISHMSRAVALAPAWTEALGELAFHYFWQDFSSTEGGNTAAFEKLKQTAADLERIDPRKTHPRWFTIDNWLARRDPDRNEEDFRRRVITDQDRFADTYVRNAYAHYSALCKDRALYECALLMSARAEDRPYNEAVALAGLARFDAAIDACTRALDIDPGIGAPRADRCIWLVRTGQYQRAQEDLEILNGMWGPHHFPAFNDHFWRGDLDAASACAEWLTGRMRFAGTYKALMSLMLGDMERSLDHFEAAAQQGGLFNTIARWASDVYLSDSLREALLVQPRWQDALAALGVGDADRRDLIAELQTLTPHTGIAVADDGTPTEVAPPQRTRD